MWVWKVNEEPGVTPGRTLGIRMFGRTFVVVFHWSSD